MYNLPRLNRVPGPPLPTNSEGSRYLKDLSKVTRTELLEIRDREAKLLANKSKLDRLPDKGERIKIYFQKVEAELARREADVNAAAASLSAVTLLDNLEWRSTCKTSVEPLPLDSDDEEVDPLRIIAQNRTEKIVKEAPPDATLITEDDLIEIESFKEAELVAVAIGKSNRLKQLVERIEPKHNAPGVELEPHALQMCQREMTTVAPKKYMPYKTTKSNVHDPEKEIARLRAKNWDATAATAPPIKHAIVKPLSMREAIEVDVRLKKNLQTVEERHAKERLLEAAARRKEADAMVQVNGYREAERESESEEQETDSDDVTTDQEEEEEDERGGVSFTWTEEK